MANEAHPLRPPLPDTSAPSTRWARLPGCATALAIDGAARSHGGAILVITEDLHQLHQLEQELAFFAADGAYPILTLPDWETLPYDIFSPHEDIVSERLATIYRLPGLRRFVLLLSISTLLQRLIPRNYLDRYALVLELGDLIDLEEFRSRLERAGYLCVAQVMEHGQFAVRGALLDLYPMGADTPYRIDLLDNEVESIRRFDPENQRSTEQVDAIHLLPAREFPLDDEGIKRFRRAFRDLFGADAESSLIYRDVSQGLAAAGIEYYIPLFFEQMTTLFEYLPEQSLIIDLAGGGDPFLAQVEERYEQRRHDVERPLLPPERLYLSARELERYLATAPRIELADEGADLEVAEAPQLTLQPRAEDPAQQLRHHLQQAGEQRHLIVAESAGRREEILEQLRRYRIDPKIYPSWRDFLAGDAALGLAVGALIQGAQLPGITLLTEGQLFGDRVQQSRRRRRHTRDADTVISNLTDLAPGAPVVHEEHGVGRYHGLVTLDTGGVAAEFIHLEYADDAKLYVPVAALHLISRYTGSSPENAPLHRLGSEQWQKAKSKAAEKISDVAVELLDVQAKREAGRGRSMKFDPEDYQAFAAAFPFEETPDQQGAIDAVLADMQSRRPMDRVVCGDVGFGKTEVAMRAAFLATNAEQQVAVLVPTTLLAQQHFQNFRDRFADWPVKIESLSRFRSKKQQDQVIAELAEGKVDIVIGTHKLLQNNIQFKDLGLIIVDEEHRFGVRHKEQLKSLRAEVDLLTLTATPIPRTLNMSLSGLRELSIIATPPVERHAVKTFVGQWNKSLIQEGCLRELKRGGQVYFLHNDVESIERIANELSEMVPEARVAVAHGQMRERELEQVMLDFYHQRCTLLVCTTIIESGIDVPTANTIIINRADKLGLAQLHQLRGRVGRSHHRAYAYLLAPPKKAMSVDAVKRLEAIESLEDLGVGFTLATHDLEIRGAGELLGEGQSGQIHEIGFTLYSDLLERAVNALKSGNMPELSKPLNQGTEIDLQVPALLPDDYVPDVHTRLVLYKRISAAADEAALRELKIELIDRFGLLPEPANNLFKVTALRQKSQPLGIRKIEVAAKGGRILFNEQPNINAGAMLQMIQKEPQRYRFDGKQTLRFEDKDLSDVDRRVARVERILERCRAEAA